jgi:hypothetical protein
VRNTFFSVALLNLYRLTSFHLVDNKLSLEKTDGLVFSVTDRESLNMLTEITKTLKPGFIIATMIDQVSSRVVTQEEAVQLAASIGAQYMEVRI